jgi:hypothetical protein
MGYATFAAQFIIIVTTFTKTPTFPKLVSHGPIKFLEGVGHLGDLNGIFGEN